jgi:hypothetical protein
MLPLSSSQFDPLRSFWRLRESTQEALSPRQGQRVRNASVRPRVHKTAPDVAPGPSVAYLLLKGWPVTLTAGRRAQPL